MSAFWLTILIWALCWLINIPLYVMVDEICIKSYVKRPVRVRQAIVYGALGPFGTFICIVIAVFSPFAWLFMKISDWIQTGEWR